MLVKISSNLKYLTQCNSLRELSHNMKVCKCQLLIMNANQLDKASKMLNLKLLLQFIVDLT